MAYGFLFWYDVILRNKREMTNNFEFSLLYLSLINFSLETSEQNTATDLVNFVYYPAGLA